MAHATQNRHLEYQFRPPRIDLVAKFLKKRTSRRAVVCTENLTPNIVVVKTAKDRTCMDRRCLTIAGLGRRTISTLARYMLWREKLLGSSRCY